MRALRIILFLLLARAASAAGTFEWSELPPLPDDFGFGGPIVGVQGGGLIVAGGANFPDGPPWSEGDRPPGAKVWHDRIFVLEPGAAGWTDAGRLPRPLAYAPAVSTDEGVYILGGESFGGPGSENANHPVAEVLLLARDATTNQIAVTRDGLPPLPKPCRYHNAALLGGVIYVTASHAKDAGSSRLDAKSFWSIDLGAPPGERKWIDLEPWPGPAREKAALVVQHSGTDDRYATPECLYLFSGSTWHRDAEGANDLSRFEHFTDAYRYNPKKAQWKRIADLPPVPESRELGSGRDRFDAEPRPAVAAPAAAIGQSHILLFGGSTGRYITFDLDRNPLFPNEILAYHTITDTWTVAGRIPEGVVTTSAVKWGERIVIPSGEIRPGVRTPRVQALRVDRAPGAFGTLNMLVLVGYLAALVGIGVWFSRREKGTNDFFLAGRRIPWWAAGISIYATQLSAITFVSIPAVAYAGNWLVYPGHLMILCFAPVVIYFYLPFFRRLNVTTAYEYLERRFSVSVRLFGSLSFIIFQLGRMAVVLYLPAMALSAVTGFDVYLCILAMGVLATAYTVMGGMEAVIWTDVIQVFVLWGGMAFAIWLTVSDAGGVAALAEIARADGKLTVFNLATDTTQMATWLIIVGNIALQFGPYTTDQAVVQRYMTTKDEAAAARSVWLNGWLTLPFSLLFFALGTCLYVFFKRHPEFLAVGMENDSVFPLFMAAYLPAGVSGLVVAGVFAASMSSLDSSMHSVATAVMTDFYGRFSAGVDDRRTFRLARIVTLIVGAAGTLLALLLAGFEIRSLFFLFQKLLGLISSGLVGIFILGIFTRRASATGAIAGALCSFAVLCGVVFGTSVNFYLYAVIGISVSVGAGYGISLMAPQPDRDLAGLTWHTLRSATDSA